MFSEEPSETETIGAIDEQWFGPIPELNRYGKPTGYCYLKCAECGTEVLERDQEHASHYESCPYSLTPVLEK